MTDKEIIIHGVNVYECAIYKSSQTRTLCCSGLYCKEDSFKDCYFKQLARSEARVKELEAFIEGLKRNLKDENLTYVVQCFPNPAAMADLSQPSMIEKRTLCYKGKALKEWEEEHRGEVKKLIEQLKVKEQECEEHRGNAESYCRSYQSSCVVNGKITDKALKYKQALDEIEKKCCAILKGDEKILYAYQIKDIINKVKDSKHG